MAEREVPISAKGHGVGAAQVPAHTHRGPALPSSQCGNTLKESEKHAGERSIKMKRLARSQGTPQECWISMDRPPLWPIVKLGSGPKFQLSTNVGRRKAKTSSVCIEIKIEKSDTFSQLSELINRAFPYPGLAQGDSASAGP